MESEQTNKPTLGYRFDADKDIPWNDFTMPGAYFPDEFLRKFNFTDQALSDTELREQIEWAWALTHSYNFVALEQVIIKFISNKKNNVQTNEKTDNLIVEEGKHVKVYRKFAKLLEKAHPKWSTIFHSVYQSPTSVDAFYEYLKVDDKYFNTNVQYQFLFWLNTVYFEDYTIYFEQELRDSKKSIQPTWLTLNKVHRQEEEEHVKTDDYFLNSLPLSDSDRANIAKVFYMNQRTHFEESLGIASVARFIQALHANPDLKITQEQPFESLPYFNDVKHHPLFVTTRKWAPLINDIHHDNTKPSPADSKACIASEPLSSPPKLDDTLFNQLKKSARAHPKMGITYVEPNKDNVFQSYPTLLKIAQKRKKSLKKHVDNCPFVVLYFRNNKPLIEALWTCQAAGLIPIPIAAAAQFDTQNEESRRLINVCNQHTALSILTDDDQFDSVHSHFGDSVKTIRWSDIHNSFIVDQAPPIQTAIALIQYSSGTTGEPKGVVLSQHNVLYNIEQMKQSCHKSEQESFVNWMPLTHDMGMIGYHLGPVAMGAAQVQMNSTILFRTPLTYLHLLSEQLCTQTGLTNFAMHQLNQFVHKNSERLQDASIDLSSLKSIVVGSEPICMKTAQTFVNSLKPYGLQSNALIPAYGLAEGSLAVSFCDYDQFGSSLSQNTQNNSVAHYTNVGKPVAGLSIQIVDEQGIICQPEEVGNIQIKGPNVFQGYYSQNVLQKPSSEWFITGDLGFVKNNDLYVVGRTKELMICNGKNVYLSDIEAQVQELPFVKTMGVAAIAIKDELVILVDCQKSHRNQQSLDNIRQLVQTRINIEPGAIYFISRQEINRTTTGKIKRSILTERYQKGELQLQTQSQSQSQNVNASEYVAENSTQLHQCIAQVWSAVIGVPITASDYDTQFSDLGGTSMQVVKIHTQLEQKLGLKLSNELLFSITTINDTAKALEHTQIDKLSTNTTDSSMKDVTVSDHQANENASITGDPIVIVGYGCHYPQANNPDQFWQLLAEGKSNITNRSLKRQALGDFYNYLRQSHTDKAALGTFFEDIDQFDNEYFGISTQKAISMDPQQRLFLEVIEQTLEQTRLGTTNVGIFASCSDSEYKQLYLLNQNQLSPYSLLGSLPNMIAAQVTEMYGFKGPSTEVNTACSSSLYAIHQASLAIQNGDCEVALVGATHLHLSDQCFDYFGQAGILSQHELPKPFDDNASGLVPGEAVVTLVLKPLSKAQQDGNQIYGIIRKTVVNNDGKAISSTAPNPKEKIKLLKSAFDQTSIKPSDLDYIEAHATGTQVGDAVEVIALQQAINEIEPDMNKKIPLGSVKSNLGHTMTAAGASSVLKVLLSMNNNTIPATLSCDKPATIIDFSNSHFYPNTRKQAWPVQPGRQKRAAINSFGLGGTNVHLIVEQHSRNAPVQVNNTGYNCLSIGGHTTQAYARRKAQIKHLITTNQSGAEHIGRQTILADQCKAYRSLILYRDQDDLLTQLDQLAVPKRRITEPSSVFVYSAVDSNTLNKMTRVLYDSFDAFATAIDQCHKLLEPMHFDLKDALFNRTKQEHLSLCSFVFCYANECMLRWLGCQPNLILSHQLHSVVNQLSQGEITLEHALVELKSASQQDHSALTDSCLIKHEVVLDLGTGYVSSSVRKNTNNSSFLKTSVCQSGQSDIRYTLDTMCALYDYGVALYCEKVFCTGQTNNNSLPIGFRKKRLWIDYQHRSTPNQGTYHYSLGLNSHHSFKDHKIDNQYSAPFAFLLDKIFESLSSDGKNINKTALTDVFLLNSLYLNDTDNIDLQINIGEKAVEVATSQHKKLLKASIAKTKTKIFSSIDLDEIRNECPQTIQPQALYEQRHLTGMSLGNSMQAITKIHYSAEQILVQLTEPELSRSNDYLISVAIIDCAMQACSLFNQEQSNALYLGFGISRIEIYSTIKNSAYAYLQLDQSASHTLMKCDIFFCDQDGHILGLLRGFSAKKVHQQKETSVPSIKSAPSLTNITTIKEGLLQSVANQSIKKCDYATYSKGSIELEKSGLDYVVNALLTMGVKGDIGNVITQSSLITDCEIEPKYSFLVSRLLNYLVQAGILHDMENHWIVVKQLTHTDVNANNIALIEKFPQQRTDAMLLNQCASQLTKVLRGTVDPLQLLFAHSNQNNTENIYSSSVMSRFFNNVMKETLKIALQDYPRNKTLNVLEVGAGTGGTTTAVLEGLESQSHHYTFTDKSKYFIDQAKLHYSHRDNMSFGLLDIERAATTQGFTESSFDMIIAANVLHSTKNLADSMNHLRSLLKENGILLILELTTPSLWLDLTFGLTDGWWRFDDAPLREDYPLLSREQWLTLCATNGFEQCAILDDQLLIDGKTHAFIQNIIVATVDKTVRQKPLTNQHRHVESNDSNSSNPFAADKPAILELNNDTERAVIDIVQSVAQITVGPLELTEHFTNLGIDSISAIKIGEELQAHLNIELSNTIIFETETIAQLIKIVNNKTQEVEEVEGVL